MPPTVAALDEAIRAGARPTYLMFPDWGGAPPAGWLAPWTPTPFVTSLGRFGSAEHHFMHGKALLFGDEASAGKIVRAVSPGQARELGRRVRGFQENTWIAERKRLMDEANLAKFRALSELLSYLLSTWPAVLVQASALDTVWGSGLDLEDPFLRSPGQWPGQNLVGFSLMKVREELRASSSPVVIAVNRLRTDS
jgi:ribA/ribD-fused uncharacterized protein